MAAVRQPLTNPSPGPSPGNSTSSRKPVSSVLSETERANQDCTNGLVDGAVFGGGAPQKGDGRIAVIIYGPGQEYIVSIFAEVLGKAYRIKPGLDHVTTEEHGFIVGITAPQAKKTIEVRDRELVVVINAHCVTLGMPPDLQLSTHCDYEFLYNESPFVRRDLARFTSFVLGQINHHKELMEKARTYIMSTTFPDVRMALPNLDILTVGCDAVEIRVDLLRETLPDGSFSAIPSPSYVGEQVMLLRQRTELPLIFTTRCVRENGRFPMDDPDLYHQYLYRAVQWGVEYIDVELWLPEKVRRDLYTRRGNSRVMSAYHDYSGSFRWPSAYADDVFCRSMLYSDMIKMMAIISEHNENFELEYFRSRMRAEHPDAPPLSAVNMGETGQLSRTLNGPFTPVTHPLLPIIAAPGQMSTAEINSALALLGQMPRKNIYGISSAAQRSATPQAPFYEKCFNELGLPHHFSIVERQPANPASIEAWCNQRHFGGAYLDPGFSHQSLVNHSRFFAGLNAGAGPILTEAARVTGIFDTIIIRSSSLTGASAKSAPPSPRRGVSAAPVSLLPPNTTLVLDNASWKGIVSTLTRDLAPSAYVGRSAVVLASSPDDAAAVLFALKALGVAKIYTVGFRTPESLARHAPPVDIEQFVSLDSLQRARSAADNSAAPFVIVSALGPEKSHLVGILVRAFGAVGEVTTTGQSTEPSKSAKKVFLDLADGAAPKRSDPGAVAEKSGFAAYGTADVAAYTTVESLRLLIGQNVPYSFVRLASGGNMY
ncbi:3-dehydroquinate dehydratase I [Geosmithia morbida]|uniref:3-dehydroquinate dehydratase I n=1 Tax=Geosmithia morbida TaxID=1094350 RepID=A0A9P5CZY3_9HYPO|nr:3-dehydroquinate dehydratase I [Geosmithia morbida]KAF4121022.1 3-dehydroquinate dehydratase I [Geosmithia morbida]